MDKEDVIRLARECGGIRRGTFDAVKSWDFTEAGLERFAALVRAQVIEEAIDVVALFGGSVEIEAALRGMKSDSGHSAAADAGASTAPLPDPQLCKFYAVETWPELVAAMEHHISKLQAKLPPTPSLAPQRVREG